MYFFKRLHPLSLQDTQFGFANFTGLAAALLFLMLLAISNDFSLRTLKTHRWKFLQRWTYAAFALTGAHGIAYQLIEKRHVLWVLVSSVTMIAVVAGHSNKPDQFIMIVIKYSPCQRGESTTVARPGGVKCQEKKERSLGIVSIALASEGIQHSLGPCAAR